MRGKNLKIFFFLCISLLFTSCTGAKTSSQGLIPDSWNNENKDKKFLEEIYKVTNKKEPCEAFNFLEKNRDRLINVTREDKSEAFFLIESQQRKMQEKYNTYLNTDRVKKALNLSFQEEKNQLFLEDLENIEDQDLRQELKSILDGNYIITRFGNKYYSVVDYNGLSRYSEHLSDECQNYLLVQKSEQDMIIDENLDIKKYLDKTVVLEKHLIKYKNGLGYDDILRSYDEKLWNILNRVKANNTEDGNINFNGQVVDLYKNFDQDSITIDTINELLDYIENKDYICESEFESKLIDLHSKAIATLEDLEEG